MVYELIYHALQIIHQVTVRVCSILKTSSKSVVFNIMIHDDNDVIVS